MYVCTCIGDLSFNNFAPCLAAEFLGMMQWCFTTRFFMFCLSSDDEILPDVVREVLTDVR